MASMGIPIFSSLTSPDNFQIRKANIMNTRCISVVLFLLLSITVFADTIPPEEAVNYIGKVKTVEGKVVTVNVSKHSNVFLNFGGSFPNQTFTAAILISNADLTLISNAKQYEGKIVAVTGTIKLYKGKPEILVTRGGQIIFY